MNSLKTVSKYESVSGILEWEIEDIRLQLKLWSDRRKGEALSVILESSSMQLAAGDGKHSKWHFKLERCYPTENAKFSLYFDGLFDSNGSQVNKDFAFKYSGVIEISSLDSTETMRNLGGGEFIKMAKTRELPFTSVKILTYQKDWPHQNLKISLEIAHLSQVVNEVFNNTDGKFLDLLDLKDPLPLTLAGCYGNLLNNPDMSDFKISCEGSSFHAHKLILSVRSRVFRTMIESGLSESSQNELKIEDMTVKTVKLMLEFIYKGTVENFPEDLKTRIQLLDCSEKYELDQLKSICMRKIFSKLPTEKEVGELAMAAFTYGANDRASKAIKAFCTTNHAKLVQDPEYKKLFLSNPQAFMN